MMVLRNFILVLLIYLKIIPPLYLLAQDIVWEKNFGFIARNDEIGKLCQTQDGNYFALGNTTQYFQMVGNYYARGVVLIKFDINGDTLFMKKLPVVSNNLVYIGHKFGNIYTAVVQKPRTTPGVGTTFYPFIIDFDSDGNVLQTTELPNQFGVSTCLRTSDYGLLLGGNGSSLGNYMTVRKINFLNEEEWVRTFIPPVLQISLGERLEPMANGHYLLSGVKGTSIYGCEFDSAGNEIEQKTYYQTPTNQTFDGGFVSQLWRDQSLSFGQFDQNGTRKVAMFCHNPVGNKIWGGESLGNSGPVFVNRELSFIASGFNGQNRYVKRVKADSSILWEVNLGFSNSDLIQIYDLCFTENDTGIVAGTYIYNQGPLGYQFYLAKIAGVGTAYDPANPGDTVTISAQEKLFRPKDAPILYPNPVCEAFQFSKLTDESMLAIYSTRGEKLFEKPIMPGEKINAFNLPKGIYLYHIRMGKRVFTGKMIKE